MSRVLTHSFLATSPYEVGRSNWGSNSPMWRPPLCVLATINTLAAMPDYTESALRSSWCERMSLTGIKNLWRWQSVESVELIYYRLFLDIDIFFLSFMMKNFWRIRVQAFSYYLYVSRCVTSCAIRISIFS